MEAKRRWRAPIGFELYEDRDVNPVLVKRSIIVSGDQLVDASSGFSQGSPAVFVKLDGKGSRDMLDTTKNNLQKPMAVILIEQKRDLVERDGKMVEVNREEREVINVATIQGVFSSNFQITGVDVLEGLEVREGEHGYHPEVEGNRPVLDRYFLGLGRYCDHIIPRAHVGRDPNCDHNVLGGT